MKTNNIVSKMFKVLTLVVMTLGLANCSKNNGSSNTVAQQYYMGANGMCYQNGTNQAVPNTYCTNTTGQYTYMNGMCYQVVNGQYIQQTNTSLCANSGYQGQVCSGYYTDGTRMALCTPGATGISYSGSYLVMNCSGYTLYNQSGQIVRCQ